MSLSDLILSHYPKAVLVLCEISETNIPLNLPLGVSAQQPGCVFDHDSSMLPHLEPQFKTRRGKIGRSLDSGTIFSIFCSTVTADMWKLALVRFWKGLVRAEFPSQMALCRAPAAAPPDGGSGGGGQKWSFSFTVFRTRKRFRPLRFQHVRQCHLDTQHHVFVYSFWVHVCCVSDVLVFDALPALSCVSLWGRGTWNAKIPQSKKSDGIRGTRK